MISLFSIYYSFSNLLKIENYSFLLSCSPHKQDCPLAFHLALQGEQHSTSTPLSPPTPPPPTRPPSPSKKKNSELALVCIFSSVLKHNFKISRILVWNMALRQNEVHRKCQIHNCLHNIWGFYEVLVQVLLVSGKWNLISCEKKFYMGCSMSC